ncbi:Cysteine-rich secretory protein family protein [Flavobacterium micromati]|uniref:Cysteine-rich secretory protein family protein n=1 Tax=Flavobacterium micromati TaxID=229205 RepID=A0A1M5HL39_9FLAO|nr:CAP domain-containing protein [Flavobacterium micromati]MCL6461839.1 CAP domain-containing protein [Flavobacterium micromati]SHG16640.1 Cysteine-rich secretory protein family protein [Flavobacterium micromati]
MKLISQRLVLLFMIVYSMNSCSTDADETAKVDNVVNEKVISYTYNALELETMEKINTYRVSIGRNRLEKINYISVKSEEHNNYMIANNVVNHNDFVARSENIMNILGAKTVSENIAYNFNTSQSVLTAWLASPSHKNNIEGNFTHFGLAIKENPVNGRKYFTNIFAKI